MFGQSALLDAIENAMARCEEIRREAESASDQQNAAQLRRKLATLRMEAAQSGEDDYPSDVSFRAELVRPLAQDTNVGREGKMATLAVAGRSARDLASIEEFTHDLARFLRF
jgi:hypothetical protein